MLVDKLLELKKRRNAVILAHNYQAPEIQDVADCVGDSLGLSQAAAKTSAEVILFSGVHFMAETAKILNPSKTVLIPDLEAGCSLADMVTAEALRQWKAEHPEVVVVTYVNSSADVKAESDYCCTSSNAVAVVESIPPDKEILFVPDQYLGAYVRQKTGRKIHLWPGYCGVHTTMTPEHLKELRAKYPNAELMVHPECGCSTPLLQQTHAPLYSTEGMCKHPAHSSAKTFLVGTETGILHRLRKEYPDRTFIPLSEEAVCGFMKKNTLEKLVWSLEDMQYEITVSPDIAARAKKAIDRMMAIVPSPSQHVSLAMAVGE